MQGLGWPGGCLPLAKLGGAAIGGWRSVRWAALIQPLCSCPRWLFQNPGLDSGPHFAGGANQAGTTGGVTSSLCPRSSELLPGMQCGPTTCPAWVPLMAWARCSTRRWGWLWAALLVPHQREDPFAPGAWPGVMFCPGHRGSSPEEPEQGQNWPAASTRSESPGQRIDVPEGCCLLLSDNRLLSGSVTVGSGLQSSPVG